MAKVKFSKRLVKTTAVVIVLLVVALGAGAGLRWWQAQKEAAQQAQLPSLPKAVDNLQNLRDTGDEAGFKKELDKALADPSLDEDTKYLLYVQEGHNALQHHKWAEAIVAYQKAQAIKNSMEIARLLGQVYAESGDTAKAIEQYKKAITLIPTDNPRHDAIKKEYEGIVQRLENGQPYNGGEEG
jgi:tetratricopeptide (TPR) repeat protein